MDCIVCGKELTGKQTKYCSEKCCRDYGKQYYLANAEKIKERVKEYSIKNRTVINERKKEYNKVYRKNQAPLNQEKQKEQKRRWVENNPEKNKEMISNWKQNNREREREYHKRYVQKHPEYSSNKNQARRTKKKLASTGFSVQDWKNALEFFENKCAYCGEPLVVPHREHFYPLSRGGGFTKDNIVPACVVCNSKKGNKNPLDWLVTQAKGLVAYVKVVQYLEK